MYLTGDILTKMDRVSMAVSLEVRVPFLSREIAEFVFSLNQSERFPNHELKGLLKRAYAAEIPSNLLNRRKAGFSIPKSFFGHNVIQQEQIMQDVFQEFA